MSSQLPLDVDRAVLLDGDGAANHAVQALRRIRAEYEEMPGLCLTSKQAARLLGLEHRDCAFLLQGLVLHGFLRVTAAGHVRA